jgi:hypothetical protein
MVDFDVSLAMMMLPIHGAHVRCRPAVHPPRRGLIERTITPRAGNIRRKVAKDFYKNAIDFYGPKKDW